jgi:hypothetical protein
MQFERQAGLTDSGIASLYAGVDDDTHTKMSKCDRLGSAYYEINSFGETV